MLTNQSLNVFNVLLLCFNIVIFVVRVRGFELNVRFAEAKAVGVFLKLKTT